MLSSWIFCQQEAGKKACVLAASSLCSRCTSALVVRPIWVLAVTVECQHWYLAPNSVWESVVSDDHGLVVLGSYQIEVIETLGQRKDLDKRNQFHQKKLLHLCQPCLLFFESAMCFGC